MGQGRFPGQLPSCPGLAKYLRVTSNECLCGSNVLEELLPLPVGRPGSVEDIDLQKMPEGANL
jgi:hypothetical protein